MSNFLFVLMTNDRIFNIRKERVFKGRQNPLEIFNDNECIQRFRFDREIISDICLLLSDDLKRPTD